MEEVEFVGHILKTDGVHFSTEKRSKVLEFPLPEKQKHLKSFLGTGFGNYMFFLAVWSQVRSFTLFQVFPIFSGFY
jgi:hypothetical protein